MRVLLVGLCVALFGLVGQNTPPAIAQSTGASAFVGLTPSRLLDTRNGIGATKAPVGPGAAIELQVTGRAGVPLSNVGAVALNVTVVSPTADGYVTVWPSGAAQPEASNLNFSVGETIPNLVIVAVGADGKVKLFNSGGNTELLADVSGYFPTSAGFIGVTPTRLLDTRSGIGAPKARIAAAAQTVLRVTGVNGIPSSGVSAVVLNVTVVAPSAGGFLTVWPTGQPQPDASNLNYLPGETIPNLVVATVGSNGNVSMFNSAGSTDLLADAAGYFTAGDNYVPLVPSRVLDTRSGNGAAKLPVPDGGVDIQVTGRGGVPAAGVGSVVLNVTVTNPGSGGYVTAWPTGQPQPTASNLNFTAGRTIPNLVVVPVGAGGKVTLFNFQGATDLIADVTGWFPGTTPAAVTPPRTDLIATTSDSTCAVLDSGKVGCWGEGSYGARGNGSFSYGPSIRVGGNPAMTLVPGITSATSITSGTLNAYCAIDAGAVKCWGPGTGYGNAPGVVAGISTARRVSFGYTSGCALLASSEVRCWGTNGSGQLGNGTTVSSGIAVTPVGLGPTVDLAFRGDRPCAVGVDGMVRCWGGGVLVPTLVSGVDRAVSTSGPRLYTPCVLLASGQVECFQTDNSYRYLWTGLVSPVATGGSNSNICAVGADRTLTCVGGNNLGQDSSPDRGLSIFAATKPAVGESSNVSFGSSDHVCARGAVDRLLRCWGNNFAGQLGSSANPGSSVVPVGSPALRGATNLSTGSGSYCFSGADGIVKCGPGAFTGFGSGSVVTVGSNSRCAIAAGAVSCAGQNFSGQLGQGSINSNDYSPNPKVVAGLTAKKLVAGFDFYCALLTNQSVSCWGNNSFGQLGNGTTTPSGTPAVIAGLTATDLDATSQGVCASRSADGAVLCWGYNGLVTSSPVAQTTPATIAGFSGIVKVATGYQHVCGIDASGEPFCAGKNDRRQSNPTSLSPVITPAVSLGLNGFTSISAGDSHVCGLRNDRTVVCWGGAADSRGVVALVPTASGPLTAEWVKSTPNGACAGLASTDVVCWGSTESDAFGDGRGFSWQPLVSQSLTG